MDTLPYSLIRAIPFYCFREAFSRPALPLLPRRIFRIAHGLQFGFGLGGGLFVGLGLRDRGALGGALFSDGGFARRLYGLLSATRRSAIACAIAPCAT